MPVAQVNDKKVHIWVKHQEYQGTVETKKGKKVAVPRSTEIKLSLINGDNKDELVTVQAKNAMCDQFSRKTGRIVAAKKLSKNEVFLSVFSKKERGTILELICPEFKN